MGELDLSNPPRGLDLRLNGTLKLSPGFRFRFEDGTQDARATVSAKNGHCTIYVTVHGEQFGASIKNLPEAMTREAWVQVKGKTSGAEMGVFMGHTPPTLKAGCGVLALIRITYTDESSLHSSASSSSSSEDKEDDDKDKDEEEKFQIFKDKDEEEKFQNFKDKDEEEKVQIFKDKDEEEKVQIFKDKDEEDKVQIFKDKDEEEKVQIFVRYYGTELNAYTVSATMLVIDLKLMIQERKGAAPEEQRLQFRSKPLEDRQTLGSYGIGEQKTIECLGRCLGGLQS